VSGVMIMGRLGGRIGFRDLGMWNKVQKSRRIIAASGGFAIYIARNMDAKF